jgi:hypothetical protein
MNAPQGKAGTALLLIDIQNEVGHGRLVTRAPCDS